MNTLNIFVVGSSAPTHRSLIYIAPNAIETAKLRKALNPLIVYAASP